MEHCYFERTHWSTNRQIENVLFVLPTRTRYYYVTASNTREEGNVFATIAFNQHQDFLSSKIHDSK